MHAKHAISGATLSHHLKVLTELGLITSRKEGLNVYYRHGSRKVCGIPSVFSRYRKPFSPLASGNKADQPSSVLVTQQIRGCPILEPIRRVQDGARV
jgi:DNA-binding transcriptional ArsR family regulator